MAVSETGTHPSNRLNRVWPSRTSASSSVDADVISITRARNDPVRANKAITCKSGQKMQPVGEDANVPTSAMNVNKTLEKPKIVSKLV